MQSNQVQHTNQKVGLATVQHLVTCYCGTARGSSFWVLLVLSIFMMPAKADYCDVGKGSNIVCTICYSSSLFNNCTYSKNGSAVNILNANDCLSKCCNIGYNNLIGATSLCGSSYNNSLDNSNSSGNSSLATILIIVFFSIPAVICLLILIATCLKRRREVNVPRENQEPPLTSVNLNDYPIEELGPMYQNSKQICSICLQEYCNLMTICHHSYHSHCIAAWIHKKQKCPLCQTRDFNPVVIYCKICFKASEKACLYHNMNQNQTQQWQKFEGLLCRECSPLSNHLDEISLDISLHSQKQKVKTQENIKESVVNLAGQE